MTWAFFQWPETKKFIIFQFHQHTIHISIQRSNFISSNLFTTNTFTHLSFSESNWKQGLWPLPPKFGSPSFDRPGTRPSSTKKVGRNDVRRQAGSLSTLLGFAVVLESWDITDVPTSDGADDANATVTTTTVSTTFTYSISTTSSTTDPNSTTVAASAGTVVCAGDC